LARGSHGRAVGRNVHGQHRVLMSGQRTGDFLTARRVPKADGAAQAGRESPAVLRVSQGEHTVAVRRQAIRFLARASVPNADERLAARLFVPPTLRTAAGSQACAVRREGQRPAPAWRLQLPLLGAGLRVPQSYRAVVAAGGESGPIRRVGEGADLATRGRQLPKFFTFGSVPNANEIVRVCDTCGRHLLSVRRKGQRIDNGRGITRFRSIWYGFPQLLQLRPVDAPHAKIAAVAMAWSPWDHLFIGGGGSAGGNHFAVGGKAQTIGI